MFLLTVLKSLLTAFNVTSAECEEMRAERRLRTQRPLSVFQPVGRNFSPHTGHSIRSKSTRLTRSGVIVNPHFGQLLSSEASTFSRLIVRDRGIGSTNILNTDSIILAIVRAAQIFRYAPVCWRILDPPKVLWGIKLHSQQP